MDSVVGDDRDLAKGAGVLFAVCHVGKIGQTVDSVPRQGELVRLRDTPLSATGGELLAVFDKVHPDNAELAVRAARLLRLDIAGVDFLSPDVGTSWRENGGQITEVNAGPQIGVNRPGIAGGPNS